MGKVQGPLIDYAGKKIGTAKGPCCGRVVVVSVNKSGWPYHYCSKSDGCGTETVTRKHEGAQKMVGNMGAFLANHERKIKAAVKEKPPAPVPVDKPEPVEFVEAGADQKKDAPGRKPDTPETEELEPVEEPKKPVKKKREPLITWN